MIIRKYSHLLLNVAKLTQGSCRGSVLGPPYGRSFNSTKCRDKNCCGWHSAIEIWCRRLADDKRWSRWSRGRMCGRLGRIHQSRYMSLRPEAFAPSHVLWVQAHPKCRSSIPRDVRRPAPHLENSHSRTWAVVSPKHGYRLVSSNRVGHTGYNYGTMPRYRILIGFSDNRTSYLLRRIVGVPW